MRKIILLSVLCSLAAASYGETVTVVGKYTNTTGDRVTITGTSATTDLILNSTPDETANTGEMYRAIGTTLAKTVTAIDTTAADGKGSVNIASNPPTSGLFVDVDSATAITAVSAASWKQNNMTLSISNSNADYQSAVVATDFGSSLSLDSTTSGQQQYMHFNHVYGTVNAATTTIAATASGETILSIDSDSKIDWTGKIVVGQKGNPSKNFGVLQIDGALSMKANTRSSVSIYSGTLNIGSNGSITTLNNTFSVDVYATANIDGALKIDGGSTTNIYGTMYLNNAAPTSQMAFYALNTSGTLQQATASSQNGIRFWRTSTFESGATWTIDQVVDLFGNYVKDVDISVTRSNLIIKEGAHIIVNETDGKIARIRMWGNSRLNLYQENAFTDQNGKGIRLATAKDTYSNYGSVVNVYSMQTFEDLYVTGGSALEIFLQNDLAQLVFEGEGPTINAGFAEGELKIYNFRENSIYVGTDSRNEAGIALAQFYDSENNLLSVRIGSDGWLTAIAVPEPAEWAAIFGALALGFALSRRRK